MFISIFSAYYFGGQSFITTLVSQRGIYSFIFIPVIFFVQPTEQDIIKALKWISIGTVIVWILVHIKADLVVLDKEAIEHFEMENKDLSSKLEFYVNGIYFVILYVYYKMYEYVRRFTWSIFLEASFFLVFIILYQNRSMLLGVVPLFLYSMYKFKSNYKTTILIVSSIVILIGIIYTTEMWTMLIKNTQSNLGESDYNRWKALYYYFNEYS